MFESKIEQMTRELRAEVDIDFVEVPFIAESLREHLGLQSQQDIRRYTLDVIERLMALGVYPGDYDYATTMSFWPGDSREQLQRIEAEWIAMGQTPTSVAPICWLGLKPARPI